jgi:hypothetical protein
MMSATATSDLTWFTRGTILFVVLNGLILTTSSIFGEIDRKKKRPREDARAPRDCSLGGPSASATTESYEETPKKSDDEVVLSYLHSESSYSSGGSESVKPQNGSVFSTTKEEDIANGKERNVQPHCRTSPEQTRSSTTKILDDLPPDQSVSEQTATIVQDERYPTFSKKPTTRASFRPLHPKDTSVLARSKRFS